MASIFDIFASQLGDEQLGKIAKQIGADKNQTQDAISMTLPALIEALGRQADQSATSSANSRSDSGSIVEMLGGGMGNSTSIQADPISVNRSSQNSNRSSFEDILPPSFPGTEKPSSSPVQAQGTSQSQTSSPLNDILGKILEGSGNVAASSPASDGLADIFGQILGNKQNRVSDAVSKSSGLSKEQTGSLISILGPILSGAIGSHAKNNNLGIEDLSNMIQKDRSQVQQSPGGGFIGKMLDQDGDGDFDMNDMLKMGMGMLFKKK